MLANLLELALRRDDVPGRKVHSAARLARPLVAPEPEGPRGVQRQRDNSPRLVAGPEEVFIVGLPSDSRPGAGVEGQVA